MKNKFRQNWMSSPTKHYGTHKKQVLKTKCTCTSTQSDIIIAFSNLKPLHTAIYLNMYKKV